jgi:hypothetical protein
MKKIFLFFIFLAGISGCKGEVEKEVNLFSHRKEMKAHCLGRHVFELPDSFVASSIATGVFKMIGHGPQDPAFDVVVRAMGAAQSRFPLEVARRRAELTKTDSDTTNVLRLDKKLGDDANLFRVQVIDDAYVSEINLLRGSSVVTVRLESYDNQYLLAEKNIIKFAAGIKDASIEKSSGFCLGPVLMTGDFESENGSYLFRDGAGADFDIDIDTYARDTSDTLLQRMSGPDSLLSVFDVRHSVMRSGERIAAGMKAQEWLGWAKLTEEQDVKTLKFTLETMRPKPAKAKPRITVTFDTAQPLEDGTPTKTLFSDEEAIQLWDSVTSSIRSVGT